MDLNRLAYDVALRYHAPEDLAVQYGVTPERLQTLMEHPAFQRSVLAYEKEINETGAAIRAKSRKLLSLVVEDLGRIAMDDAVEPSDRIKAASELARIAGLAAPEGNTAAPFQLNIQVNAA